MLEQTTFVQSFIQCTREASNVTCSIIFRRPDGKKKRKKRERLSFKFKKKALIIWIKKTNKLTGLERNSHLRRASM